MPRLAPHRQRGLSLKIKLTGAILMTIATIAAIVHIPWVYTSRRNVQQMISQLHAESFQGAKLDAAAFFDDMLALQQLILSSFKNDLVDAEDPLAHGQLYLHLLHANPSLSWVQIGFANGDFLGANRRADGLYNLDRRQWDTILGEVGIPGSELEQVQAERKVQALAFAAGETEISPGQPDWQVATHRFDEGSNLWGVVEQSQRNDHFYAPARPWYQAAWESPDQSVWTDVYRFKTDDVVGLDAAVTYRDPQSNELRGVVSVSFGLRHISDYLANIRTPAEGLLFILDRHGQLIAASDPNVLADTFESDTQAELLSLDAVDNPLLQTVNQALQDNNVVLANLDDITEFLQYDRVTQEHYFIALSPLGRMDWTIGSITPEAVFLSTVTRNQQRMQLLLLALLGGGVIVLWQINDRLLIRPIVAVSDAAAAMEAGTFHPAMLAQTAQRDDEWGQLAEVFQNMAVVIGDREKTLMTQLESLRDSGTGMAGSQLELAYYQALTARAARLRSANGSETGQFPPSEALGSYYRALKERAESVRSTRISGAEVEQLLRGEGYLATLPDGDLRELAQGARRLAYAVDEEIFQEGDTAEAVYGIAQGSVTLRSTSQDAPLRILQAGQLFGDLTLMLDIPRITSAHSRENTVIYAIDRELFSHILRQNPQAMEVVEQKLTDYQDVLADAPIWLGESNVQLAAGATLADVLAQQLRQWWHGQMIERSVAGL